jgi:tRNA (guanine-N7-)-methyltransferase
VRLKHVPGARELIENSPKYIIDNKENEAIELSTLFTTPRPIHIEIGMGKGQFVYTLAKQNPNINYIGIERFDSAIVKALYKVIEEPLDNLMLIRTDATDLITLFGTKKIERIYLNFSDPWPKERHAKRRLTHHNFLKKYQQLLLPNGDVHFKTDNIDLFNYSVESLQTYPMVVTFITYDLHDTDEPNIMTEFEEKFSKKGFKINKLIAHFEEDFNE